MSDTDLAYYRHRAEAEVELAAQATHPHAVAAHYQLADAYFRRADLAGNEDANDA